MAIEIVGDGTGELKLVRLFFMQFDSKSMCVS